MENIDKLHLPFEVKVGDLQENGIFRGYASTFGGDPDLGGDVVLRGAFNESVAKGGRFGRGVKMLYQHDYTRPIGKWNMIEENNAGLKVEGQLAIKTRDGSDVYELMKIGAIDSLSIGYNALEVEPGKGKVKRYLKKVDLHEISPVTFPMNTRATITNVKMLVEEAKDEKELEAALREVGLSVSAAKYIVSLSRKGLREAKPKTDWDIILKRIKVQ